jgi:hypothetical protein
MRRLGIIVTSVGLLAGPVTAHGAPAANSEGCQAFNPGQPTCSFKVTHTSRTPITGVAGVGKWVVKVKRDGKSFTVKSPANGQFWATEIAFKPGDKVRAEALAPGSGLSVGHPD